MALGLLFIGVHPAHQGKGLGGRLIGHVESKLREQGNRILLVETSSLDTYEATREFYFKKGFTEEARIREYYSKGEDKIVFWKALSH